MNHTPILGPYLRTQRLNRVLQHVKGDLLDVGCGENLLVKQYGKGVGADVYQWGDVDVVLEDSAHLPFPDASFDTVSFVACLNHIPEREQALREAYRVLRPGGQALATMIPPHLSTVWHHLVYVWDSDQNERGMRPGEVYGISSAEMRRLFIQAGFTMRKHERFVFWLNNLYVAEKPM